MQQHSRRLQANLALLLPFGSIPLPFEKLIKILKKKHNYFIHRSFVLQYRGTMIYILLFSISFVDCFYGSYLR